MLKLILKLKIILTNYYTIVFTELKNELKKHNEKYLLEFSNKIHPDIVGTFSYEWEISSDNGTSWNQLGSDIDGDGLCCEEQLDYALYFNGDLSLQATFSVFNGSGYDPATDFSISI